jgi:AraC-like DNA-binding protein
MPAIVHSTTDVAPRQSFEYWHDWVCGTFVNLDCDSPNRDNFSGSLLSQPISSLLLTTMVSDRMELARSPARIAAGREDCLLIAIEGRTTSALLQDGREGVLHAGDFAIVDSCRPYSVLFQEGFQHHVLRIPRREMTRRVGMIDAVTGSTISGSRGAGKLASTLCRIISGEPDTLPSGTMGQVADSLLDLFAVAIGANMGEGYVSDTSVRNAWFVRIRNYIDRHLAEPALSRSTIAAALGVSVRYLTDIFSSNDMTVNAYIWERRMHRCCLALDDPSQRGRSISSIAYGWGFNDTSHFSRAFKERYGITPSECRERAQPKPGI